MRADLANKTTYAVRLIGHRIEEQPSHPATATIIVTTTTTTNIIIITTILLLLLLLLSLLILLAATLSGVARVDRAAAAPTIRGGGG